LVAGKCFVNRMSKSQFDQYATQYETALQKGLSVSGESSDYFAVGRVRWLKKRLLQVQGSESVPVKVLDFGCGTGNSVAFLLAELQAKHVLGIDTSEQSLAQARTRYSTDATSFSLASDFVPRGEIDLAYCNGVFHHIPPEHRAQSVDLVYRCLKPGGWFAFWENNPWNPGTRYVMSKIPFDRDAITLTIPESKRLLARGGFDLERVDSCFYFPRALHWFRPLETRLSFLPLGAQYMVLARKPLE